MQTMIMPLSPRPLQIPVKQAIKSGRSANRVGKNRGPQENDLDPGRNPKKSKKSKKERKHSRSKKRKRTSKKSDNASEDGDEEKETPAASATAVTGTNAPTVVSQSATESSTEAQVTNVTEKPASESANNDEDEESDEDDVIGPKLSSAQLGSAKSGGGYGGALRPGEGAAIASYVQQNKRIPRRGEVGWTGEEIEELENMGYVMSGSRHKRMNEVRLRKENQVYSAEEKSALALFNYEEKQQRENQLMSEFRKMLAQRDMGPDAGQGNEESNNQSGDTGESSAA
eukprot:gb/GECG01000539.1/.p1 GENE.gb/GECG01000539.1/~~gb/GECG01000539.1/.p1  ORF type:complete len:285 (+),score=64.03 gb/GECG01000539.1/:1-855(+)